MRNLLILFILVAGLGSFLILWDTSPEIFLMPKTAAKQLPEADSYMENTETIKFSDTGEREYTLVAKASRYYQEQDYWQVDVPHLIAYDQSNKSQPWELKADHGEVLQQGKEIKLLDNVIGWQYSRLNEKRELTTSALVFYPEQQLATTDQALTITTPEGITSAVGMQADFAADEFFLLSRVRGKYRAPE